MGKLLPPERKGYLQELDTCFETDAELDRDGQSSVAGWFSTNLRRHRIAV